MVEKNEALRSKPRRTNEKMEDKCFYHPDTDYAFTLNPANGHQFYGDEMRVCKMHTYFRDILTQYLGNKWNAYMEISEPYGTRPHMYDGPRLHVHGTVRFSRKRLLKFLVFGMRDICKIGYFDIEECNDTWNDYMTKQKILPKNYRHIRPLKDIICRLRGQVGEGGTSSTRAPPTKMNPLMAKIFASD